jgi:hypothetical protein
MTQQKVPVFDKSGKIIGYVSQSTTSVGASKIAKRPVEFSARFGVRGWVAR